MAGSVCRSLRPAKELVAISKMPETKTEAVVCMGITAKAIPSTWHSHTHSPTNIILKPVDMPEISKFSAAIILRMVGKECFRRLIVIKTLFQI